VTCVVGIRKQKGGVLLVGDSQSSTTWIKRQDTGTKVFLIDDTCGVAYCGSGRFGQILQFWISESVDPPPLGKDLRRWLVREFIEELRNETQARGHLHIYEENQVEHFGQSAFLIACRDRLFSIEEDFSVNENILPFEALGSGGETAFGVLHSEWERLGSPEGFMPGSEKQLLEIATRAITAAEKSTTYVGGPINTVTVCTYTPEEIADAKAIVQGFDTPRDEGYGSV
jgi:20S proteasome alpha/beta subunit